MPCPLLRLLEGEITASEAKELYSKDFLAFTTSLSYTEDPNADKKGEKILLAYNILMEAINKLSDE